MTVAPAEPRGSTAWCLVELFVSSAGVEPRDYPCQVHAPLSLDLASQEDSFQCGSQSQELEKVTVGE